MRAPVARRRIVLTALVIASTFIAGSPPATASRESDAKVVGGGPVVDEWPEVVYVDLGNGACTGTLLDDEWVLTAAHCIQDEAVIYGGSTSIDDFDWAIDAEGYPHPEFDEDEFNTDFGLYQLEEPAPVDADVDLADYGDTELWQYGTRLRVLGWGLTDGGELPDELLIGTLEVQLDNDCSAYLGPVYDPTTMLCLWSSTTATCNGDSGGPIFGMSGSRMRVVGVVSWGLAGCDFLSIGAWVPAALDWIESMMESSVGDDGSDDESGPTEPESVRVAGTDRYETASAIASAWDSSSAVFIATGENYPDSLAAGPAAASLVAPILLVKRDGIPLSTRSELNRLSPSAIYVVGGSAAVSDDVLSGLRDYADTVLRLAGPTRIETATAITEVAFPDRADRLWLAPSTTFQDPLLAGAAAAVHGEPLLLLEPGEGLTPHVRSLIERLSPAQFEVVGGPEFATSALRNELAGMGSVHVVPGKSAYVRGASLWSDFEPGVEVVVLSTGTTFPDALVGAPYAALDPASPLMLTTSDCVPDSVSAEIERLQPQSIVLLGGTGALSSDVEELVSC